MSSPLPATDPEREPRPVYQRHLTACREASERCTRRDRWLSRGRIAIAVAGLATAWWLDHTGSTIAWALLWVIPFLALVQIHERILQQQRRWLRAIAFYERGLRCLDGDWRSGPQGLRYLEEKHPYARDLDLFGPGSLFQRLSLARTRAGEDFLAGWLKTPATAAVVRDRQAAVQELGPRVTLREQLAVLGADIGDIDVERLKEWCVGSPIRLPHRLRYLGAGLTLLTVAALGASLVDSARSPLAVLALICDAALLYGTVPRLQALLTGIERRARDLEVLAGILACIEREPFEAPALAALVAALKTQGMPPSARVTQLGRLAEALDWRRNQLFIPLDISLLWTLQVGLRLDAWRQAYGRQVLRWLEVLGEFEALSSLAAFHFETPACAFPEMLDEGIHFAAEDLAHPLLPPASAVPNSLQLATAPQVLVVTGSNMSGKSTLLRTVGVNTVLALAGAPVAARRLRLSAVQVASTLCIQDSLQAGRSRFFTEILRLRQILDLARGRLPVLFLLDEILHGTNSHDRQVGSAAIVRHLVACHAIGLVTTHDLSLAQLAESLAPTVANVHFVDDLRDGELTFDYKMRPGAVEHSNAIELMRSIGISV